MAQTWVDIPLPRRLNLDGSRGAFDPIESPNLTNILTHEVGQIRQRRKFSRVVKTQNLLSTGDQPVAIVTAPNFGVGTNTPTLVPTRALITYTHNATGKTHVYRAVYPSGPYPTGYTEMLAANIVPVFINADVKGSETAAAGITGTDFQQKMPFTPSTQFDNSTMWTSGVRLSAGPTKVDIATGSAGCRLVRWGGQNNNQVTATTNVNAGSTSVTLNGTVTPSLAGMFMSFRSNGSGNDPVGHIYNYYVLVHVAGTSAVTLLKPFGLGDAAVGNHVGFTDIATFSSLPTIINSPVDVQCCIAYLNRIFVGRPSVLTAIGTIQPGAYPNAIAWSDPGEPEKWTDTNFAQLDSNSTDPVMGFGTVPNALVIFRRRSTWIMTGTDESTFTYRQISAELGCLDARSITQYQDTVFFMSDYGLMSFDGSSFDNLVSQHLQSDYWRINPTRGIRTPYVSTSERFAYPEVYPQTCAMTTVLPRSDFLLMSGQNLETASDARHDNYLLHIPSRAWVKFNTANTNQVTLFTKPGQHLNYQGMGMIANEGLVLLDTCVEPEVMSLGGDQGRYDESYNPSTGANTSFAVVSTVTWPDVRPTGNTFRLHRIILEHNIWNTAGTGLNGPNVTCGVDPFFGDTLVTNQTVVAGNVQPRYQAGGETATLYDYRFSTELAGSTWPVEGTVARISATTSGVSLDASNASHPPKYLGLRLLLEPTDKQMIDNPITS